METSHILQRFHEAKRVRQRYDSLFQDLMKYFSPYQTSFYQGAITSETISSKAPKRDLYNTEGVNAAEQLTSTICQGLINYADPWFALGLTNTALSHDVNVRRFLEAASEAIMAAINDTRANFYAQAQEFVADLVIYGTACMYVEDDPEGPGVRFCTYPLSEIYIAEDNYRKIDTVFREFEMTPIQIMQRFPDDLPSQIIQAAKSRPDETHRVLHVVARRDVAEIMGFKTSKDMPWASYYILLSCNHILEEGGYQDMPYVVARWSRRPGEVYGRSPAWTALPDVKRANAVEKTLLETAERQGNPPLLTSDDGVVMQTRLTPGAIINGGLDAINNMHRIQPMQVGGNLPIDIQILQMLNQGIRERFFVGVLSAYNPGVEKTATEISEFRREESRLMGPSIGRIQSEMLEPIVERVKNILGRKRALPPLPDSMINMNIKLTFTSPLARMQQGGTVDAISRTLNAVLPFIQTDPTLMSTIKPAETFAYIAEVNGVPAKLIASPEELAAEKEAQAQQQQLAMAGQALQMGSEAQLNLAKAASLGGGDA